MNRASALAAALALAVLAAGWALLNPGRLRRPALRVIEAPRAENAEAAPLGRFEGGAIVELATGGIWLNGEELPAEILAERPVPYRGRYDLSGLTEALEASRDAIVERHKRGEGPEFSRAFLLAASPDVPYQLAVQALLSASQARFEQFYLLVDDPQPTRQDTRTLGLGLGQQISISMRGDRSLDVEPHDPELAAYGLPSPRARLQVAPESAAQVAAEVAGEIGPMGCVTATFPPDLPWGEAIRSLDTLAPLDAALLLSWSGEPFQPASPPPPEPKPSEPAAREQPIYTDSPLSVLRLAELREEQHPPWYGLDYKPQPDARCVLRDLGCGYSGTSCSSLTAR